MFRFVEPFPNLNSVLKNIIAISRKIKNFVEFIVELEHCLRHEKCVQRIIAVTDGFHNYVLQLPFVSVFFIIYILLSRSSHLICVVWYIWQILIYLLSVLCKAMRCLFILHPLGQSYCQKYIVNSMYFFLAKCEQTF